MWFEQRRKQAATEMVTLHHKTGASTMPASVIEPGQVIPGSQVKIEVDHMLFIIETKYLASINLARGVQFARRNRRYEVIQGKDGRAYMNDPNHLATNIMTKLCSLPPS